jgi:hypothetical protein
MHWSMKNWFPVNGETAQSFFELLYKEVSYASQIIITLDIITGAATLKKYIFRDVTPCSLVEMY